MLSLSSLLIDVDLNENQSILVDSIIRFIFMHMHNEVEYCAIGSLIFVCFFCSVCFY